jgi:hypothetical protein
MLVKEDRKVKRNKSAFCIRGGKNVVEENVRKLECPVHTAVACWRAVKWDERK